MKTFLTFLLFCFFSSNIYSQEIPWVNVGVGYPFITSKTDYSVGEVYADGATFNLFTEVPFLIKLKIKPEFVISPGISYVRLQVSQEGGGLGGGSNGKFDRKSVSVYTKLQYKPNFNFTGNNNWNLGLVTGYYLNTKVEGKLNGGIYKTDLLIMVQKTLMAIVKTFSNPFILALFQASSLILRRSDF